MPETAALAVGADRAFVRGAPGYEEARCAIWNAKKPSRFPDIIVVASSERDVVEAVRWARGRGVGVAIRGGGHSMRGSPIRDGGMLLDVGHLREISVDPGARTASLQPGVRSDELGVALARHGLAFPVGHDGSLPMSGFLLSGGLGWNSGEWGPACFSIRSVDVVTADAAVVTADEHQNTGLYWAARGAGGGFFGVATRFRLAAQPLPPVIRMSGSWSPLTEAAVIGQWIDEIRARLPRNVELRVVLGTPWPGTSPSWTGPGIGVLAVVFAGNQRDAAEALALIETCPAWERGVVSAIEGDVTIATLQHRISLTMPSGHRCLEDTLWSNESIAVLLPRLAEHITQVPSTRSFIQAAILPPPRTLPDAAFSMTARTFLWFCALWQHAADDDTNEWWLSDTLRRLEPLGVGHYIAGADLLADPQRSVRSFAPASWDKLQRLKRELDPEDVFYSFLRPG